MPICKEDAFPWLDHFESEKRGKMKGKTSRYISLYRTHAYDITLLYLPTQISFPGEHVMGQNSLTP